MRIGIDARELFGRPTGVGRYLAHLLTAWDDLPEAAAHQFMLYAPADQRDDDPVSRLGLTRLSLDTRRVAGGSGTRWEQVHLAAAIRRDRPHVLFSPAYTSPLAIRTPVVVTVHDLSFIAHPEWFPVPMRWRQRLVTTCAARRARRVLTVSEFSRREIVERLGVPESSVSAIPHGLTTPSALRGRPVLDAREPLVLFVGSIFNRRHVPELIAAVSRVHARHPDVRLEVVGDNRTFPRQDLAAVARASGIADRVALRSYVSDTELADLYARAGAFCFLSDYEGLGLTPLEALSCGVPILVGDTPVAREIYGRAACFVATTDEQAVAASLERLLFDEPARAELLGQAPAVLGRYCWERAGRDTLAALVAAGGSA